MRHTPGNSINGSEFSGMHWYLFTSMRCDRCRSSSASELSTRSLRPHGARTSFRLHTNEPCESEISSMTPESNLTTSHEPVPSTASHKKQTEELAQHCDVPQPKQFKGTTGGIFFNRSLSTKSWMASYLPDSTCLPIPNSPEQLYPDGCISVHRLWFDGNFGFNLMSWSLKQTPCRA